MLFSAPEFFIFFAAYLFVHFLLAAKYRMYLVVVGGIFFYGYWEPSYIWVPVFLTAVAWAGVLHVSANDDPVVRRRRTIGVIVALSLPLLIVKYSNFVYRDFIGLIVPTERDLFDIALPLGISFITFTTIAYVIDVYRGRFPPERSILHLAGYVLFFPHLIAGPILRPHELLPQLKQRRDARQARFTFGIALFAVGFVKKLVFADQIAQQVEIVYAGGGALTSLDYLLAIYGFSLQIYCDFSGYTDMAVGLAAILGVRLPTNFRHPYTSASIVEFWRRWHITLSHWLRDYLYIPLGGNRSGLITVFRNILITMGLGGLWHGANWTFLIWGLMHGFAIVVAHAMRAGVLPQIRLPKWLAVVVTFHLVTIAWVFFRAPDVFVAVNVLSGVFTAGLGDVELFVTANAYALMLIGLFTLTHRFDTHARVRAAVKRTPKLFVYGGVAMAFVLSIAISAGSSAKFIYFDF
jgi:alginate O-acetyltransferase complex protein AlgI